MQERVVLLCAGGTGGHLFPAKAVAHELKARGYTVHLATDERASKFTEGFPAEKIYTIPSATFASKSPNAVVHTLRTLFNGYRKSKKVMKKLNPVVVAGFGGYPTLPPLFAASRLRMPTLIHEANAVLGRANRLLSSRVDQIAIGFGEASDQSDENVTITGNPVRPEILEVAKQAYPKRTAKAPFQLLVFGGSQGAAFFSEILPQVLELLPQEELKKIRLVQQARPEDRDALIKIYTQMDIKVEVESFFSNMAEELAKAHLVISRAGASTVSELAVVGRPAILVPFPHALDHDQATNAKSVVDAGGVQIFEQSDLSPQQLADEILNAISDPKKLATAAENAKKTGTPNATQTLADMLEQLALNKQ